ncbi:NDR1/HIN1-like protein 6 [Juglans microcarpa x Juglans regia]|uniref:NDR1/HIN1-like protein 6 n=1 Tax=Juglans microcarpa x Juglans regia TaxID=2249226 RepID=UPI001B7EE3C9|nr:NDR1/HIN1-like protein 6 [Juglans microcarpa x Juglans regia]
MADLEEHNSDESRTILLDDYSESESSLCCLFFQVLIILGFFSVVIWVSVTPKSPIYLITNAYIPAFDARNSTSNHSHNTPFFLNLDFFNPNEKMSIYYSDICITLYYSTSSSTDADHLIGSSSLPGFYQGYKETTPYEVVVNADQQLWKGNNITNGTKEFKVFMENDVKYKIVGLIKVKHQYRIYKEAYVSVDSNGKMIGEKNIKLHHTSKIMTKRH